MSSWITLAAILLSAACSGHAANIVRLETKTHDTEDAGMTFGSISIDIYAADFTTCKITDLDHQGNDFQQGMIDTYEGSYLQGCNNFTVPNNEIGILTLTHSGTDAWYPEWISILFDDSQWVQCPNPGGNLDQNESTTLYCGPYGEQ